MKTEFLKGLGLDQIVIDQIMAENGKDVNAEKAKAEAAQSQLSEVQEKLKAFEGVDVSDLKTKVAQLTADLTTKDTEYQRKLAEIEFSRTLETAVAGMKPRNAKAVMALLDTATLQNSKNQQADIAAALEAVKKDNDYLFESAQFVWKRRIKNYDYPRASRGDYSPASSTGHRAGRAQIFHVFELGAETSQHDQQPDPHPGTGLPAHRLLGDGRYRL